MIRTEPSSVGHVVLSFRLAARLSAALLILVQAGCSSEKAIEPKVEPAAEPAVATSLSSNSKETQAAYAGSAVVQPPSVMVKDQRGAGMGGVTVTFAVAGGGGTVTDGSATTNAAGIATVGSWILGATPGLNTLTASASALPLVTFAATGTAAPCFPVVTYDFGTTTNGTLGLADCLSDAVFTDWYSTPLSEMGAYVFRLSAIFDTYIYLTTRAQALIADNNNESSATTNSVIKALLPSGWYVIGATSWNWGDTGAYSLSSEKTSPEVTGCEEVYIVPGVSTTQNIQSTDCLRTEGPVYADEFLIYLTNYQSLTLSMVSTAVDSFLELYEVDPTTGARSLVASNDNVDTSGSKDARLVYTFQEVYEDHGLLRLHVILARPALNGQTGGYTLGIQ